MREALGLIPNTKKKKMASGLQMTWFCLQLVRLFFLAENALAHSKGALSVCVQHMCVTTVYREHKL
jgi:hypothetical protein